MRIANDPLVLDLPLKCLLLFGERIIMVSIFWKFCYLSLDGVS